MKQSIDFRHISEFDTPDESPGYLLWRVSIKWRGEIEQVLKPLDLTHPQFVVMATLGWLTKDGDKVNQVDVGRLAGFDPNTTSQILRGLEKKGFVARKQKVDERSKNPVVTKVGAQVLAKATHVVENTDKEFFAKLGKGNELKLMEIFQKLYK